MDKQIQSFMLISFLDIEKSELFEISGSVFKSSFA